MCKEYSPVPGPELVRFVMSGELINITKKNKKNKKNNNVC